MDVNGRPLPGNGNDRGRDGNGPKWPAPARGKWNGGMTETDRNAVPC